MGLIYLYEKESLRADCPANKDGRSVSNTARQFNHSLPVIMLKTRNYIQWCTQEICSGGSTNSFEDRGQRERGSGGSSPRVWGFGGSCNLVQEISLHIVKFSYFLIF